MSNSLSYSLNQLRDYSSLFLRNEAVSWMNKDFSSLNRKIERYDERWIKSSKSTYYDYLKYVYSILEHNYQNEYILKNEFLNKWLIKELGQSNSIIFSEYRVGKAIADLVMFNGHSKVFEIKTEYDNDSRLELQLKNYRKAFNQIFLIVPENKVQLYEKYESDIGIITFNSEKPDKFHRFRDAELNQIVDMKTIMHILHTSEYKEIVKKFFGELPKMTSFNQFNICSELIKQIPNHDLNLFFIEQMKQRNFENKFSSRYYKEFNQLSLALKLNKVSQKRMIQNLKVPLKF